VSITRPRHKTDETQDAIVDALLAAGCLVQSLATVGMGCPDLLVQDRQSRLWLVECKSPGGKLTDHQRKFLDRGWSVVIAESPEDVLRFLALVRP